MIAHRMELRGKTIVVTGAGGFVGRAVCARLLADEAHVAAVDRDRAGLAEVAALGAEPRRADVTDRAGTAAALEGADGVVHTAALVGDWGALEDFVAVNVRGTRNVLDAAGTARVVHVSSVATWGYEFRRDLDEDAPVRACGEPYVDTKAAAHVLALRRGAAVVRPGDVYGPRSVPWTLRPLQALRARTLVLPGRGDGLLTLVYVDDLVDCLVRALTHPAAAGRAVTAWDGHPVTAREFFGRYARMLGRDGVPTLPAPLLRAAAVGPELLARVRGGTPSVSRSAVTYVSRRAVFPNARARELLGWRPQVDLDEGMRRTEAWLRAEGLLAAA
jgi:nucleoside-diphosphate-sugar epimerase